MRGFGLPDVRLTADSNAATPTESTPRPGSAVAGSATSKFTPVISGAQGASIDTYVTKAGNANVDPQRLSGLCSAWRLNGGTYQGYAAVPFLHHMDQIATWSTSNDFDGIDCVTIPSTQKVVAVVAAINASSLPMSSRTLDPSTWTWGSLVTIENDVGVLSFDVALCVLPDEDETVLLARNSDDAAGNDTWRVYASTDAGATWATWSDRPFVTIGTGLQSSGGTQRTRMAASADDVLFVRETTSGPTFSQWASSSAGTTFTQVGADWTSSPPTNISVAALPGGAYGMAYNVTSTVTFKRISNAYESLESATAVTIKGSTTPDSLAMWVDPNGVIYVTANVAGVVNMLWSVDGGTTWVDSEDVGVLQGGGYPFNSGDGSTQYQPSAAAFTSGRAIIMGNSVDAGGGGSTPDGMIWACHLGGWMPLEGMGWLPGGAGANGSGQTWIPLELPTTISTWTAAGAGTETLATPGLMNIATSSNARSFADTNVGGTAIRDAVFLFDLDPNTGGSATTVDIGADIDIGDGTNLTTFRVNFLISGGTSQYAIYDTTGAAARGTVDTSIAGRIQVLVYQKYTATTTRVVSTWWRSPGADTWTQGHDEVTVTTGASAGNSSIDWGHVASSTADSDWYQFHFAYNVIGGDLDPPDAIADMQGAPITSSLFPLPTAVASSGKAAFLSTVSGPGVVAETHDIDAQHDYPKERVFVSESPSSIEKWRSTGVTEEILAQWEPNEDGQFETNLGNGSVFLYLEGVNFRQAVFEGSTNGGSTWSTIGTFDARVNGAEMLYTKVGDDAIEVDATGNDSNTNRYLWYGEMVGGTTVVNTEQRRIRRNTEGAWQDNGDTTRQARIWMSGIDGGESGTAAMQLWAPRGVLIVHNVGAYDTYRVRIPSQTVADSYFECGRMMCGSIHPAGKQWSRGWSVTRSPNSTSRREPGGATRTRRTGKALRSATVAWPDGIDLTDLRVAAADPDYLIAGSGNELAAVDDVPYWLMGILEDMKSGEEPVLLLFEIPDASGNTITDWSLFLCGRFASQVSFDHSLGDENSNEFGRVSPITIEELP